MKPKSAVEICKKIIDTTSARVLRLVALGFCVAVWALVFVVVI